MTTTTDTTLTDDQAPSTLRQRATEAACAWHVRPGRINICTVGQRTADAVLLEVADWLREQADHTVDFAAQAAIRGLADLIVIPGRGPARPEGEADHA